MIIRRWLYRSGAFGILACGLAGAAAARECPVAPSANYLDHVFASIANAASCREAAAVAEACALGASGDVAIAGAAQQRCERALGTLNASQQRTYAAQLQRCEHKYAGQQGTMYLSMTAFCKLQVTQSMVGRAAGSN